MEASVARRNEQEGEPPGVAGQRPRVYPAVMEIKISPLKIACFMSGIALTLIFLSVAGYITRFHLGYNSKLISGFSLGYEANFPTYYQSLSLLFCAVLIMFVAFGKAGKRMRYTSHWFFLSAIFVYLSADEMLQVHEKLIVPVRTALHTSGLLYFAWVIPFGILLTVFLLLYIKFLLNLPGKTRNLFIASGAVFILGAIGVEMLGGRYCDLHGSNNFAYVMYQTVEESLEMFGIVLFAYALADYIKNDLGKISIHIQ